MGPLLRNTYPRLDLRATALERGLTTLSNSLVLAVRQKIFTPLDLSRISHTRFTAAGSFLL